MDKYFPEFQFNIGDMKWLEEALRNRQFARFELGMMGDEENRRNVTEKLWKMIADTKIYRKENDK